MGNYQFLNNQFKLSMGLPLKCIWKVQLVQNAARWVILGGQSIFAVQAALHANLLVGLIQGVGYDLLKPYMAWG